MTIYEIKRAHLSKDPDSHFFDRSIMKFFGQTLGAFRVAKMEDGRFRISAPQIFRDAVGRPITSGKTVRFFNPSTGELEIA